MTARRALAQRRLRTAVAGACLTAAAAGCTSIRIEPAADGWTVTGEEDSAVATWTAADVDVVVPLVYEGDATHVAADVLNRGPSPVRLTFAAPGGTSALLPLGRASGGPPAFERTWTETIHPGRPIEVPAGGPGGPGSVRLALLPDARWGPDDPPPVGSGITFDLSVVTASESVACGFRFRVTASPDDGWSGLDRAGRWAVVVLLVAVSTALLVWAD